MVQHRRLRRARGGAVVVRRDGVEQLRENRRVEIGASLFDHSESQVDVPEQSSLVRRPERGPAAELADPADVVEQRRCEKEVRAEAGMELDCVPAERRHADRVLEQASGVAMVALEPRGGERSERRAHVGVAYERADEARETVVCDLVGEEVEEAVELVRVTPQRGSQIRGIGLLRGLHGPNLHLQLAVEALHAPEDAHRVALPEAAVEQLDVVPHACLDPPARVRQLERQVRRPGTGPPSLLARDREHAFDRPILGELRDRGHASSLRREAVAATLVRSPAMAVVEPFRAVRYTGAAGPLDDLVAPPYDAVTDEERERLFTRSPYNVLHLTLPESAEKAADLYRGWLDAGILEEDEETSAWLLVEHYVGPDGVARERHGVVASVAAQRYGTGSVLPHERTHERIREDRLQLLRTTRVQPEPIFLLHDGAAALETPEREPDLAADGSRLWRLEGTELESLATRALLVADGHHRYESAIELAEEEGGSGTRIMALIVSVADPGLRVFPTHRVFSGRPDLAEPGTGRRFEDVAEATRALEQSSTASSATLAYRRSGIELVEGAADELDVELVDRHGLDGISYTPDRDAAIAAVDGGAAQVAFLLRGPRVEDVFELARRGGRMPPKSTYFFPKPLSGMLFHPVRS